MNTERNNTELSYVLHFNPAGIALIDLLQMIMEIDQLTSDLVLLICRPRDRKRSILDTLITNDDLKGL